MNQNKIYKPKVSKYLLIDPEPALEIVYKPDDDDLMVQKLSEGKCLVLRDGVPIAKYLNCLVDKYGCRIAFLWDHKEDEQLKLHQNLDQECKKKGLKGFPSLAGMAVRDASLFKGFNSENPMIVKSRVHKVPLAGYEKEVDGKKCIRDALSKVLDISETARSNHVVFECDSSAVSRAQQEGWKTYDISQLTLREALCDFFKKMSKSQHDPTLEDTQTQTQEKTIPKKVEKQKSWPGHPSQRKWFIGNYCELSDMIEATKSLNKGTQTFETLEKESKVSFD